MQNQTSLIFGINRHALDDGPGIRTVILFKGCPLQCVWCHNPESIDPRNEIGFYPSECIQNIKGDNDLLEICDDCARSCPNGAVKIYVPERIDRALCKRCGICVEACPGLGLRNIGQSYEVGELVEIILHDRIYYQTSDGGVTLSGGEPTMHMGYASELLKILKEEDIHTAIETCGFFEYSEFNTRLLPYLDLILFDVKLVDTDLHQKYTGKGNTVILENLARLATVKRDAVIPRIPLIPGITANHDNLREIMAIFKEMRISRCWLLPYNPTGFSKLAVIGKPIVNLPKEFLSEEEMADITEVFSGMELVEI